MIFFIVVCTEHEKQFTTKLLDKNNNFMEHTITVTQFLQAF